MRLPPPAMLLDAGTAAACAGAAVKNSTRKPSGSRKMTAWLPPGDPVGTPPALTIGTLAFFSRAIAAAMSFTPKATVPAPGSCTFGVTGRRSGLLNSTISMPQFVPGTFAMA